MNARLGLIVVAVAVALYFLFKSSPAAGSTVFTGSTAQPVGIGTNGGVAGLESAISGLGLLFSGQSVAGPGQSAAAAASLSTGIQAETGTVNSNSPNAPIQSNASIQDYLNSYNLPAAPTIADPTTAPSLAGVIGSSGTSIPNLPAPTNAVVTPDNGTTTSLFSLGDSGDDDPAFDAFTLGGGNSFLSSNVYSS